MDEEIREIIDMRSKERDFYFVDFSDFCEVHDLFDISEIKNILQ